MGEHDVRTELEGAGLRQFMTHLLDDLRAYELMLARGMFEHGVHRIGAEQELFLVDRMWRPAPVSLEVLKRLDDRHFTTEIAAFNLEINADPLELGGDCFRRLESQVTDLVEKCRRVGEELEVEPILIGSLPTIRESDLKLENLTPVPRYGALDRALSRLRGGAYEFRIKGVDELIIKQDTTIIEGCNTSFQVHLQVDQESFARFYNTAQVVAAPVLAAATNSPLLFGRRLWRETRIALFQQSVDTRGSIGSIRVRCPRVTFGTRWVDESPLEIFHEDALRYRALIGVDLDEDPFEKIAAGVAPELKALRIHTGTVYRWNRACYGIVDGKPHIRIENRILPSGPTPVDEIANSAFWIGLMIGMQDLYGDVRKHIAFDDARMNFLAAARMGLAASFTWMDGHTLPAQPLVCDMLIPIAREGLAKAGVDSGDAERYLSVIHDRVASGRTGSCWLIQSFEAMKKDASKPGERLNALVGATLARQKTGEPVSTWPLARLDEAGGWMRNFTRVDQYMTTDLFTVREDEPIDLVAAAMDWRKIRHVPVEDNQDRLVGILSYRTLLRLIASGWRGDSKTPIPVSEVMRRDPVSISPATSTLEAIRIMREHKVSALPVVTDGRLVGIVSERDFMEITSELLETMLREGT